MSSLSELPLARRLAALRNDDCRYDGRSPRGGGLTLRATTSTSSALGDNGADRNQVVRITDDLDATTMDSVVSQEEFAAIDGPTSGTVYRGVAYVP